MKNKTFAKLFMSSICGQILVRKDKCEISGSPRLTFTIQPEGYGQCSVSSEYEDNEKGWQQLETTFEACGIDLAEIGAKAILQIIENGGDSNE